MVFLCSTFQGNSLFCDQESWLLRGLRLDSYSILFTVHCKYTSGVWLSCICFPHTASRCWHIYMRGNKCSRLHKTRHQVIYQYEACLQGDARWCNPEQRPESGPVLSCSRNTATSHFLDFQQQSLPRYYHLLHFKSKALLWLWITWQQSIYCSAVSSNAEMWVQTSPPEFIIG